MAWRWLLILFFISAEASANFQSDMMKAKRPKSTSSPDIQWTLADWLSQKNKVSLMDQWLAMHSSRKIFEWVANGAGQQYTYKTSATATGTTQTAQDYQTDIFISLFNLNGEYQKTNDSKESFGGAAGLRLLGTSAQSTSLIARYGWRRLTDLKTEEHWDNQYAEAALQLYVIQQFGLTGSYRYYFPATSNQGDRLLGHKVTVGAFIEAGFLRIYGDYFQEPLQLTTAGTVSTPSSDGFEAGIKLFF